MQLRHFRAGSASWIPREEPVRTRIALVFFLLRCCAMRVVLFGLLAAAIGCQDPPTEPDPDPPDAGSADADKPFLDGGQMLRTVMPSGQLFPSVERSAAGPWVLEGRLGAHAVETASSARFRLQGGFRSLSR